MAKPKDEAALKTALRYNTQLTIEELAAMPDKQALKLPMVGHKVIRAARRLSNSLQEAKLP